MEWLTTKIISVSFFSVAVVSLMFLAFSVDPTHAQILPSFIRDLPSNIESTTQGAVQPPEAQTEIPGPQGIQQGDPITDLGTWVIAVYRFGIGIAGILAVMMMMMGGLMWLMSGGSPDKIGRGKEWIVSALIGLLLAIFSFGLLYTINPQIVEDLSIDVQPIGGSE